MKHTAKKTLSLLLALVMMFSLLPGRSATAYAVNSYDAASDLAPNLLIKTGDIIHGSMGVFYDADGIEPGYAGDCFTITGSTNNVTNCTTSWTADQDYIMVSADLGVLTSWDGQDAFIANTYITLAPFVAVTGVTIMQGENAVSGLALTVGDTAPLTAVVAPSDASKKTVTWESSNTDVATVNNGVVSAVGAGSATIYAIATNGTDDDVTDDKSVSVIVFVSVPTVAVSGVTIMQGENPAGALALHVGDTAALTAVVEPGEATNQTVTWTSDDEEVATVDENGVVSAVGEGSAIIMATATNGTSDWDDDVVATALVNVSVPAPAEPVTYLDADGVEQQLTENPIPVTADMTELGVAGQETWYIVNSDVEFNSQLTLKGKVHLILTDGKTMNAKAGISDGNGATADLSVYGQSTGENAGQLIAANADNPAVLCKTMTINGGNVQATATGNAAGINSGADVIVNGGSVNAAGGLACIYGNGISIKGGVVNATGTSSSSAGLAGMSIVIEGGDVTASGGSGIFGSGTVSIKGGVVDATGTGNEGSGLIGMSSIDIEGGNVTARGSMAGALALAGAVKINGGDVTASGGQRSIMGNSVDIDDALTVEVGADESSATEGSYDDQLYVHIKPKSAPAGVAYIDASGAEQTCSEYTVVESSDSAVTWSKGWYVVKGADVRVNGTINYTCNVNLILMDGAKLTVTGESDAIKGAKSCSFTVYGQGEGTGTLEAATTNTDWTKGINAEEGAITINGGTLTLSAAYAIYDMDADITINGGTVTAIASGNDCNGIYNYSGNITINGGTVTASASGENGEGIYTEDADITITGGTVSASGGNTGICAYPYSVETALSISGGTVTAIGGTSALQATTVDIDGALTVAAGADESSATDSTYTDQKYVHIEPKSAPAGVAYIDASGAEQTCSEYTVVESSDSAVTWSEGWYVVTGADVRVGGQVEVFGSVNLILADGAKLNASCGVHVAGSNSLTVYGQSAGSGELIADASNFQGTEYAYKRNAGIGSGVQEDYGKITLNGGKITATGGSDGGSGIGGGKNNSSGSTLTINGGVVTAYGGYSAAGIGGGDVGSPGTVIINGGAVYAYGGAGNDYGSGLIAGGAGIGKGTSNGSYTGIVTINGGTVTAKAGGTYNCNVIGNGTGADGTSVSIQDGLYIEAGNDINALENVSLNYGDYLGSTWMRIRPGVNHTVSFLPNGAEGSMEDALSYETHGYQFSLPNSGFTPPEGKLLLGWTREGDETVYAPGAVLEIRENTALTAQWGDGYLIPALAEDTADLSDKPVGYSVPVYDCGGPSANYDRFVDGTLKITAPAGKVLAITGSVDTESDYDFLYVNGEQFSGTIDNFSAVCSGSAKLRFTSDSSGEESGVALTVTVVDGVSISFAANGGSGEMADDMGAVGYSYTLPGCSFTAPEGKLFSGWTVADGETLYRAGDAVTVAGATTFTAQWAVGYEIPLEGEAIADLSGLQVGDSVLITEAVSEGSDEPYDEVLMLRYGSWYSVTGSLTLVPPAGKALKLEGGFAEGASGGILFSSAAGDELAYLYGDSARLRSNEVYELGYGDSISPPVLTEINGATAILPLTLRAEIQKSGEDRYLNLRATVVDVDCSVRFDAGEGSGEMAAAGVLSEDVFARGASASNFTVPACSFTPLEGKLFSHWLVGQTEYRPGDWIKVSEDMTLTAQYADAVYATFLPGYQGAEPIVVPAVPGSTISLLPADAFVRSGKIFTGWKDAAGAVHAAGESYAIEGDVSFTAQWSDGVQIGTEDTLSDVLPTNAFYNYSLSQQLFTPDELGSACTITGVGFYSSNTTRNLSIYLAHTQKTDFSSPTDWVTMTADDLVFSGEVSFVSDELTVIPFTSPFAYNGTDNLLLCVQDNTGTYVNGVYFMSSESAWHSLFAANDGSPYDVTNPPQNSSGYMNKRANTLFLFESQDEPVVPTYAVAVESQNCRVTVTGADDLSAVPAGTVLTVAAEPYFGYKLPDSFQSTVTVESDLTISVVAEPKIFKLLALNHENGAEPTCSAADWNNIPFGTKVTVTAGAANDNYGFIGWYETNGTLLSSNAAYSFAIDHDTTLEARYQAKTGVVTFMGNGQIIKEMTASSVAEQDFPDVSTWYGYEFTGWDKSVDDVNAALTAGENITVTAQFRQLVTGFTVTIYNGESETPTVQTLNASQWINLTAQEVSGKNFAGWTKDDVVFSYNARTSIRVAETCTIRATYQDAPVVPMGTAVINSASYNQTTKKASFVAYLTVPTGAKIVKAGLVASSADVYDPTVNGELTWDNAQYQKSSSAAVGASKPVSYTWTKSSVNVGNTWYVRPYVIYTYNGVQYTVYGNTLTWTAS